MSSTRLGTNSFFEMLQGRLTTKVTKTISCYLNDILPSLLRFAKAYLLPEISHAQTRKIYVNSKNISSAENITRKFPCSSSRRCAERTCILIRASLLRHLLPTLKCFEGGPVLHKFANISLEPQKNEGCGFFGVHLCGIF